MTLSISVVVIFMTLQTQFIVSYPYQKIMNDFDNIWNKKTNNAPLKYVGGDIKTVYQFNVYNTNHPTVILETFGHENPWINHQDVMKSGALIVNPDKENIIEKIPKEEYTGNAFTEKYRTMGCTSIFA